LGLTEVTLWLYIQGFRDTFVSELTASGKVKGGVVVEVAGATPRDVPQRGVLEFQVGDTYITIRVLESVA
jgi:hypothetical protein